MTEQTRPTFESDFLLQEYVKLREEIQSRTGIQQQLVTIGLLTAGATLTIGANNSVALSIPVLLLYPALVMFLAIAWATQYATIQEAGAFLARLEEEVFLPGRAAELGWESFLRRSRGRRGPAHTVLSGWGDAKGIFLGIEGLAVALAIGRSGIRVEAIEIFSRHPEIIRPYLWLLVLGFIDVVAIIVTISLPESLPAMRRATFRNTPQRPHTATHTGRESDAGAMHTGPS